MKCVTVVFLSGSADSVLLGVYRVTVWSHFRERNKEKNREAS